jgi:hypothetical protein
MDLFSLYQYQFYYYYYESIQYEDEKKGASSFFSLAFFLVNYFSFERFLPSFALVLDVNGFVTLVRTFLLLFFTIFHPSISHFIVFSFFLSFNNYFFFSFFSIQSICSDSKFLRKEDYFQILMNILESLRRIRNWR